MKFFCNAFAVLMAALCTASTASALPLTWRADWPDCKPVEKYVHRGTDVELQPQWYINGELANSTNWTFQTFVQTNAQATGEWFGPLPGAAFSHTNDIGAAFYNVMVRAQMPGGGVNYTAFARLRMLDSPGFTPGELPLPVSTIDFSQVVAINAPWLLPAATNDVLDAARGYTDTAISQIPPPDFSTNNNALVETIETTAPAPGNYAVVSNAAIYAAITNALQDTALAGKATKADATLTPIYGPTSSATWTITYPQDYSGDPVEGVYYGDPGGEWGADQWYYSFGGYGIPTENANPNASTLTYAGITATRTDAPVGYQLGSQTNAPLASADMALTNSTDIAALASRLSQVSQSATNYTDASISPTSPAFSNAVLSVGLGIDTNIVAAINELVDASHDLPVTGATSVGALLLALAAAVAALKRKIPDVVAPSASATSTQAASASSVWSMIGDVESALNIINNGASNT